MDKTQIDERLARLRARAADVLGEPLDTSDAGGLSQVERAIQVGEAAAFRDTLTTEWSVKAERVRQWFMSLADAVSKNDVRADATALDAALVALASDIRVLAAEIPCESEVTTAARLREAENAEAARQVARCAAELGYVGEPATLAVAVGDACLAFARELREIRARHAVTVKRLEAELAVAADQADLMRHVAELLCYPDDDNHDAEQHPGSRRGGCYPAEVHYVVRLPVARGATYREVTQEHGTLAWSVREVSAEEAERSTRP